MPGFSKSAQYYDAIYAWKDYAGEARALHQLIQTRNPGARTLLDVACGTGQHLRRLRRHFEVEGVDLDANLLEVARARLPGVPLHRADMRTLDLPRRFDVVTCLFSAVGYLPDAEALDAAVGAMARHLAPGGVLIVEPWFSRKVWRAGQVDAIFVNRRDLKIARLSRSDRSGRISVLDFEYLVGADGRIRHFTERHELTLFTTAEYRAAFRRTGLATEHDPQGLTGRGLYIGVRRA
jgi:SAM-dependent methyltransferase